MMWSNWIRNSAQKSLKICKIRSVFFFFCTIVRETNFQFVNFDLRVRSEKVFAFSSLNFKLTSGNETSLLITIGANSARLDRYDLRQSGNVRHAVRSVHSPLSPARNPQSTVHSPQYVVPFGPRVTQSGLVRVLCIFNVCLLSLCRSILFFFCFLFIYTVAAMLTLVVEHAHFDRWPWKSSRGCEGSTSRLPEKGTYRLLPALKYSK